MRVNKTKSKVFGATFTNAEKKAMTMEIQRQLAEYDRKNELEIDAMVLWILHEQLGFGYKRLKRFYDGFSEAMDDLINRYELDNSDRVWLCSRKLKDIGVDVELWSKERR